MQYIFAISAAILLTACSTGPNLDTESCQQLSIDYAANTEKAFDMIATSRAGRSGANVLIERNIVVKTTAEEKGCKTNLWTVQPSKIF